MNLTANVKSFGNKTHEIRERAADSLESAAESVRSAGKGSSGVISGFTKTAGKKLESTAAVVRGICLRERMMGNLRGTVRRNPMRSVAFAITLGLVAGFTFRR